MVLVSAVGSELRFAAYVEGLASVIGHKDRVGPLRDYCTGLMLPCERKSVEPMAAVTGPARTAAQHQSLCRSRWLGIGDLIAEPEGPSFISRTVAHHRLDR